MNPTPPSPIRIGPFNIFVEDWSGHRANAAHRFGEFSPREEIIRIDTSHSRWQVLDTLLHEILHAIWWAYNLPDDEEEKRKEEDYVAVLATAWTQIWRDNPRLFHYISLLAYEARPMQKESS